MLHDHDSEIKTLKAEIKDLKNESKELRAQVHTLSLAAADYRRVRQRFICRFKNRELPDFMEESDHRTIQEGNIRGHREDAAVDALLYEGVEGRRDIFVFRQLYGLHPSDVQKISE